MEVCGHMFVKEREVTPQESVTQWHQCYVCKFLKRRFHTIVEKCTSDIHLVSSARSSPINIISTRYCIYVYQSCFQSLLVARWIGRLRTHRTKSYKGIWISPSLFPRFNCAETDFQTGNTASQRQNWDLGQSSDSSLILFSLYNILDYMIGQKKQVSVTYLAKYINYFKPIPCYIFNNKVKTKLVIKR